MSYPDQLLYTLKPLLLSSCLAVSACSMNPAERPFVPVTLLPQNTDTRTGFVGLSTGFTETDRGLLLSMDNKVFFALDSAILLPAATGRLDEIARFINQYPERNVAIEGHADSTGPAAYNLELSQQRAMSVRDALVQRNVAAGRLTVRGFGETRPVVSNNSAVNRQKNRRVEIIVLNNANLPPLSTQSRYLP